jgi:hypothetical protein
MHTDRFQFTSLCYPRDNILVGCDGRRHRTQD